MKVHKPSEIPAQPVNAPLFTGGPVTRQTLLTPEASEYFNLGIVNFSPGARNKMHTHSSDQVLFVTAGKGIIATETEQQIITLGDIVHIPSEEKHWHGATPDSAFSHIALTAKGSTTTQSRRVGDWPRRRGASAPEAREAGPVGPTTNAGAPATCSRCRASARPRGAHAAPDPGRLHRPQGGAAPPARLPLSVPAREAT